MTATTFLVFYTFKSMNSDEATKAKSEWKNFRSDLPSGIELIGEYDHACYLNRRVAMHSLIGGQSLKII